MKRSLLGGVLAASAIALGGCATPGDVSEVAEVACSQVATELDEANAEVERLADTPGEAQQQALLDALQARAEQCADDAETTEDSASSTASGPTKYVGWDQIVAAPPEGLQAAIGDHTDQLDFGWSDVDRWASQRSSSGNPWDARVVAVFGDNEFTPAEARADAGVEAEVAVVRVTACTSVAGADCPDSGAHAVLLRIDEDGVPQLTAGVLLRGDDYSLLTGLAGEEIE